MGARERAEAEALIRNAADISIARQISVSRQQSQMLVKARMAGAVVGRRGGEREAGVAGRAGMGDGRDGEGAEGSRGGDGGMGRQKTREVKMEKILVMKEKRVLTPLLVEVQQGRGREGMGQRRSEHGLLVGFEKA